MISSLTGYFKMTSACTNDLIVNNYDTSEVIYNGTPPATILFAAQLTRFVYPTIRLLRTKTLTAESVLNA